MWKNVSTAVRPDPANPAIPIATMRKRLNISHETDNDLLVEMINGSAAQIDGLAGIGIAVMKQTWRKSFDAFPSSFELPGWPVKSVTAIKYRDVDGENETVDLAKVRVDVFSEPARVVLKSGEVWPATDGEIGAVQIEYIVGEEAVEDVDPQLITAISLLTAHQYENREAVVLGSTASELPLGVTKILDEFSRLRVSA